MKIRKKATLPRSPRGAANPSGAVRVRPGAVHTSRLTARGQTVIPQALRKALGLGTGDILRYEVSGGKLIAEKLSPSVMDDPFAFFTEWSSAADDAAFAYLSDVVRAR